MISRKRPLAGAGKWKLISGGFGFKSRWQSQRWQSRPFVKTGAMTSPLCLYLSFCTVSRYFYRCQVRSLPCIVSHFLLMLNVVQLGFVKDVTCISLGYSMHLLKLIKGFLWVVTWICQNWNMDFSKLSHGFVKVATYTYLWKMLHLFIKVLL